MHSLNANRISRRLITQQVHQLWMWIALIESVQRRQIKACVRVNGSWFIFLPEISSCRHFQTRLSMTAKFLPWTRAKFCSRPSFLHVSSLLLVTTCCGWRKTLSMAWKTDCGSFPFWGRAVSCSRLASGFVTWQRYDLNHQNQMQDNCVMLLTAWPKLPSVLLRISQNLFRSKRKRGGKNYLARIKGQSKKNLQETFCNYAQLFCSPSSSFSFLFIRLFFLLRKLKVSSTNSNNEKTLNKKNSRPTLWTRTALVFFRVAVFWSWHSPSLQFIFIINKALRARTSEQQATR